MSKNREPWLLSEDDEELDPLGCGTGIVLEVPNKDPWLLSEENEDDEDFGGNALASWGCCTSLKEREPWLGSGFFELLLEDGTWIVLLLPPTVSFAGAAKNPARFTPGNIVSRMHSIVCAASHLTRNFFPERKRIAFPTDPSLATNPRPSACLQSLQPPRTVPPRRFFRITLS